MKDYYDVLGVPPSATTSEIRHAYFALARKYHPDMGTSLGVDFGEITEAKSVLLDEGRRRGYDKEREMLTSQCGKCLGKGVVFHQRGFTGRVAAVCSECCGRGRKPQ